MGMQLPPGVVIKIEGGMMCVHQLCLAACLEISEIQVLLWFVVLVVQGQGSSATLVWTLGQDSMLW